MAKLAVNLGGVAMKNPVTTASGTFGYGQEYDQLFDVSRLGAVTVKGIRACPWPGNPLPRHAEVPGGLLNAIGLQGPGVEAFIRDDMPFLVERGVPAIVNIWGTSAEEYAEVAAALDGQPGVSMLEINVSCPNVKEGGASFGTRVETFTEVVRRVRAATSLPIMPKLAPNVPDVRPFVRAAQEARANAVSLIHTLPGNAVDLATRRPIPANRTRGPYGPRCPPPGPSPAARFCGAFFPSSGGWPCGAGISTANGRPPVNRRPGSRPNWPPCGSVTRRSMPT